jgi:SAM-dependent methyltransferase
MECINESYNKLCLCLVLILMEGRLMQQSPINFIKWWQQPIASQLLRLEEKAIAKLLASKRGNHLVQMGGPDSNQLRIAAPIAHQVYIPLATLNESMTDNQVIIAAETELPLQPDSIDLIIIPHVIEFSAHPEALLKAVYLALKPEGYLLSLNFNRYGIGFFWYLQQWQRLLPWRKASKWTKEQWLSQLHRVGFTDIQHWSLGFLPRLTTHHNGWLQCLDKFAGWYIQN